MQPGWWFYSFSYAQDFFKKKISISTLYILSQLEWKLIVHENNWYCRIENIDQHIFLFFSFSGNKNFSITISQRPCTIDSKTGVCMFNQVIITNFVINYEKMGNNKALNVKSESLIT